MEKILIFGINGFSGINFLNFIQKHDLMQKYDFIGVDKIIENQNPPFKMIEIDIRIEENLSNIIKVERPEYIINLVGIYGTNEKKELILLNSEISRRIFEIVIQEKIKLKKLLLIGSAAEYGQNQKLPLKEDDSLFPINYYGLSKVIQTQYAKYYAKKYNFPVNIARTFNILGKNMPKKLAIGRFIQEIDDLENNKTLYVGNINTKRDYLYIEDVIDAYWKILIDGIPGQIYNVCSGKSICIKEFLHILLKIKKKKLNIEVNEAWIREDEIYDIYGDNSLLKNELGWNFEKNIIQTFENIIK